MNRKTREPTKIWYDILKAEEKKEKKSAGMDEKNKYCQKHFNCNYSECTPQQKSQCDKNCGNKVSKGEDKKKPQGKKGSLPDLNDDGKISFADVLEGRGVNTTSKKSEQKNVTCNDCNSDSGGCPSCSEKEKEVAKMLLQKAMPCPICGAGPGDGPMECAAGEVPMSCSRRISAMRQMMRPQKKGKQARNMPRRMR